MKYGQYIPDGLTLQWHITGTCNLRCQHCYHTSYNGKGFTLSELEGILEQYKDLLKLWRKSKRVYGHINVTGGEPFLHEDFMDLLDIFSAHKDVFSFAILTNGTVITPDVAKTLKKVHPRFVQISIEGNKETHDTIRSAGNFDRSGLSLKYLAKEKIPTCISFTVHKKNYKGFSYVAEMARKVGVTRLWADRLIPIGSGKSLDVLTPEETCTFFHEMYKAKRSKHLFKKTEIAMHRALQFLVAGGKPYKCAAGDSLITVQANGDVYPCRRMPIKIGNVMETDLTEIYYGNEVLRKLRDKKNLNSSCKKCFYSELCNGGLKCLSYAVTGDPFEKDPGCWYTE